ncbi:hypothetical protein EDD17DRAFT_1645629 [Pisolithus thermaeus]|nr:hypothetical protein EDD17DRAFT_1645629 [Pisolithus thermaeus]
MDPNKIGHSQEKDFANPKLRLFPHRQLRFPKTRHARGWHRIDAIITDNFFLRPELHIYHATWSGVPNFQSQHSNLISFYQLINHYVASLGVSFQPPYLVHISLLMWVLQSSWISGLLRYQTSYCAELLLQILDEFPSRKGHRPGSTLCCQWSSCRLRLAKPLTLSKQVTPSSPRWDGVRDSRTMITLPSIAAVFAKLTTISPELALNATTAPSVTRCPSVRTKGNLATEMGDTGYYRDVDLTSEATNNWRTEFYTRQSDMLHHPKITKFKFRCIAVHNLSPSRWFLRTPTQIKVEWHRFIFDLPPTPQLYTHYTVRVNFTW